MNDDDVSTRAEAASAYLDGELDAAERASVAADPETMALVDSFARVRNALGEVDAVSDDIRIAAVSAALAEFDAGRRAVAAPARAASPATVTVLQTRWQRAYRVLGGVAAAAVIVVVGIAMLNATKGSDSKSSASATTPASRNAAADAPQIEAAAAPAGTAAPAATEAASSEKMAATMVPAINSVDDLARYAAGYSALGATTSANDSSAGAPSFGTEVVPSPAAPPSACLSSTDTVLGPISVLGSPAYAVRDDATGIVRAIDANGCRVYFSTTP